MPRHIYNCTITLAKEYTKKLRELNSKTSKLGFLNNLESILDENRKKAFSKKSGHKKEFRAFRSLASFADYMAREHGVKDILNKNRFKQVGRVERYRCPIWYDANNILTLAQKTHIITLTDKTITFYSCSANRDLLVIHFKDNRSAKTFFQTYLFGTVYTYRPINEILEEESLTEFKESLSKTFQSHKTSKNSNKNNQKW